MTLPSSGVMTAAMINVELGRASNAPFSINGSAERALAGKPSGAISFSDFYGKSNIPPTSVTSILAGSGYDPDSGSYYGFGKANTYAYGYPVSDYGSTTPANATINGATVKMISDVIDASGSAFRIVIAGDRARSFFNSFTINGVTRYTSNSRDYFKGNGNTIWGWAPIANLKSGTTYPVTFT